MAEKGDVPMTPEMIMAASTNPRRSSMGCISPSNSGEKLVPHYLRASTGSCHDFCKYGRKHTFETKTRQPLLKNMARKSLDGNAVPPEGKKMHPFETKTRQPLLNNMARNSLDSESSVDNVVPRQGKKKHSFETQTRLSLPKSMSRNSLDSESSVDNVVVPLEGKKKHTFETRRRLSLPKNMAGNSLNSEISVDSVVSREERKTTSTQVQAKARVSSTSKLSEADPTTFRRPELSKKSPVCSSPMQREVLNERKKKLLAETRTSHYSRSHATNAPKNLKPEASSASRNSEDSVTRVVANAKERKLPEKCENISKPKFIIAKPLRSAGTLDNSRKKSDSKMGKSLVTFKEASKKVVATSRTSLSSSSIRTVANLIGRKHSNLKAIPLKTHNKIKVSEREQVQSKEVQENTFWSEEVQQKTFRSEEVEEKTLYVIKIGSEETSQQSDQNETDDNMEAVPLPPPKMLSPTISPPKMLSPPMSPSLLAHEEDDDESEYAESEAEDDSYSEGDELGSLEEDEASSGCGSGISEGRSQNLGMFQLKEKDPPQSIKLSFRRGKIVDIHSETNSPRRLKFRRGRLLGENQMAMDALRKNFKKGKEVDSDTNAIETAPETVVLRHQDVQGKKDAQGLFNNVIEETASKLVETRKSKVKALVGAFETVISLQDGKPSLDTVP